MAEPLGPGSREIGLRAEDGVGLRAALRPGGGRGLALLLQGRTEFCEKYLPLADALAARGFAVATLDWRGQGASDRLIPERRAGHVEDFADYQRDLRAFLTWTEREGLGGPRLALAHSMGGAIALRAQVEERLRPPAMVYSAPMWGLTMNRWLAALAPGLAGLACALGLGARFAPGGGRESYAETDPEPNVLTADPDQAAWIAALTRARPDLALGGPTWAWLRAALREMAALQARRAPDGALVLVGGEEAVTAPPAMRARAKRDSMTLIEIAGGRHELFFEAPARRGAAWRAVDDHLTACGI